MANTNTRTQPLKPASQEGQWIVDLDNFSGPLDLLLHLIQKQNIDIFDIPIVEITRQYIDLIHAHQERNLDVASDYLVMAATLVEIKTKLLLPKPKTIPTEEEEDPRQPLVAQLVAYQQFKALGEALEEQQSRRVKWYSKAPSDLSNYQAVIPLPEDEVTTDDLLGALTKMVQRLSLEQPTEATIQADTYTIEEAMTTIEEALDQSSNQPVSFASLLSTQPLTRNVVVTLFLALLQLTKRRMITFEQEQMDGDILLRKGGAGE
ncbi:MAG: segregation/condensation protein A [Aerococcus sp.]|nr:segregation/condensation protein A [Aerococcus sp.]